MAVLDAPHPLRLVFVAPEEPLVMPVFFERVIPRLRHEISAIAIVRPVYARSSYARQARQFAGAFGLRDFLAESASYARSKASDRLRRKVRVVGRLSSLEGIARANDLRVLAPDSVNGPEFLEQLRHIAPHLVISVSCPQIFGAELLALPRHGCVNVHSALLPDYRGVLPTFWALANGAEHTGVTVHRMNAGIDGGDIVAQRRVPIGPDDTLHALMRRCKEVAADLVVETVEEFRAGDVETRPNPAGQGSYYSFPTRGDVRRFRAQGRRLR
jgi:methionyl-tRNA formyltransferase